MAKGLQRTFFESLRILKIIKDVQNIKNVIKQ